MDTANVVMAAIGGAVTALSVINITWTVILRNRIAELDSRVQELNTPYRRRES